MITVSIISVNADEVKKEKYGNGYIDDGYIPNVSTDNLSLKSFSSSFDPRDTNTITPIKKSRLYRNLLGFCFYWCNGTISL